MRTELCMLNTCMSVLSVSAYKVACMMWILSDVHALERPRDFYISLNKCCTVLVDIASLREMSVLW